MDQILAYLQTAYDYISNTGPTLAVSLGILIELALRYFKTEKPKSLIIVASAFVNAAAAVASKLGEVLTAFSSFLDSIIGQRLK